jgi:hypothetical protein
MNTSVTATNSGPSTAVLQAMYLNKLGMLTPACSALVELPEVAAGARLHNGFTGEQVQTSERKGTARVLLREATAVLPFGVRLAEIVRESLGDSVQRTAPCQVRSELLGD